MSIKKSILILAIIAVIGTLVIGVLAGKKEKVEYTTAKAVKGDIVQTVSEAGTVKATSEIKLNFLNVGKIEKIKVHTGDRVVKDEILAELDYSSLLIAQAEANAAIDIARASLNKLISGATGEDIAVSRASVEQAKKAYETAVNELEQITQLNNETVAQAQKALFDLESSLATDLTTYEQAISTAETVLNNTKNTYQNAIDDANSSAIVSCDEKLTIANNSLDTINRVVNEEDAENVLSAKNSQFLTATNLYYNEAIDLRNKANTTLAATKISQASADISKLLIDTADTLQKVKNALENCYYSLENSITSTVFTLSELETFKTLIKTEQSAIATAINTIQTKQQNQSNAQLNYETYVSQAEDSLRAARATYDNAVITAQNSLNSARLTREQQISGAQGKVDQAMESWEVAQAQLNKILAPANKHDIALEEARLRQARTSLESINQQINDSIIKAPIDGTITEVNYEIGEQVKSSVASVLTLLGNGSYEIDVLISEADIAKVKKHDKAAITLDSYGEDVEFSGEIIFIEPAETIIQDVIYYKVISDFDPLDYEVKSGMTANINITTAKKEGVLIVPSRSVIEKKDSGKFVRVLEGMEPKEKKVELGLRGDEGMIEIISGLKEGEEVVTAIKNEK